MLRLIENKKLEGVSEFVHAIQFTGEQLAALFVDCLYLRWMTFVGTSLMSYVKHLLQVIP